MSQEIGSFLMSKEGSFKMEKLKDKVIQKINNEYDNFVKELKQCDPEEIIDRAYEHVCKQEMLYIYMKIWIYHTRNVEHC